MRKSGIRPGLWIPITLARAGKEGYRAAMNRATLPGTLCLLLLASGCREPAEVSVAETRPLTMRERELVADASSRERFEEPTSIVPGVHPDGWERLPGTQFRILNYRFGRDGTGEVAVGVSQGGLLGNVNRWLKQFGEAPLDEAGLRAVDQLVLLDAPARWITAEGEFAGGMGQQARSNWGLAGAISDRGGQIVTVKMIGPADEVRAQHQALREFVAGLRPRSQ